MSLFAIGGYTLLFLHIGRQDLRNEQQWVSVNWSSVCSWDATNGRRWALTSRDMHTFLKCTVCVYERPNAQPDRLTHISIPFCCLLAYFICIPSAWINTECSSVVHSFRESPTQPVMAYGVSGLLHWKGVVWPPSPSVVNTTYLSWWPIGLCKVFSISRWLKIADILTSCSTASHSCRLVRWCRDSDASGWDPGSVFRLVLGVLCLR